MKWNFNELRQGDEKQGIRDGDMSDFSKTHFKSVVRESIQNSLDARDDYSKPVEVNFSFKTFKKDFLPYFSEIEARIKECSNYTENSDDKEFISTMMDGFRNQNEYECMIISDYNTIGMELENTYDSFANSRNISSKNSKGSAGSKGMGKAVYFASSYLQSILVSTKSSGNSIFQGISKIGTHKYQDKAYSHKGFFGNNMMPFLGETEIPESFRRSELGTSIYIIGLKAHDNQIDEMKKELLANFWLSIYDKDLIVKIGEHIFNHENIYEKIKSTYNKLDESGQYNKFPNPRPYIETYLGIQNTRKIYKSSINHLGDVKLFLANNSNYPGRIAFYRKSKMLIYKDGSFFFKGYCGLFICDDEDGNEILKKLENAKHNEWDAGNWSDPIGRKAIASYKEFVSRSVKDFIKVEEGLDISIPALDALLGIKKKGMAKGGSTKSNNDGVEESIVTQPPNKPEKIPKNFNWLRCKAKRFEDSFEYDVSIDSKVRGNNLRFEVLVGSDNKDGKNTVNILSLSDGNFSGNVITVNLKKGINILSLVLEDNLKHTIRLKEYKPEVYEN